MPVEQRAPTRSFLSDQPSVDDRLGFMAYVDTLVHMIRTTWPPITIGVFGPENAGKTTFLRLIEERLTHDTTSGKRERLRDQIPTPLIHFDAASHPIETIGAQLVRVIIRELEQQVST